jgi:hypothetical protein
LAYDTAGVVKSWLFESRKSQLMAQCATLAGSHRRGVEDGAGELASFNSPSELLTLPDGSLLVADTAGDRIRRICRLAASEGAALPAGTHVETISARGWLRPMGMALLPDGSVLVCDHGHNRIRRLSPDLSSVTPYAGSGLRGSRDGPAESALFDGPRAVCVWHGLVLVTDGHAVRIIAQAPSGGLHVLTVAGGQQEGYCDGHGTAARFRRPGAMLNFSGSVLVCDTGNHCIRHLVLSRASRASSPPGARAAVGTPRLGDAAVSLPSVSVLTLCGRPIAGSTDGALHVAQFSSPSGLAALPGAELVRAFASPRRAPPVRASAVCGAPCPPLLACAALLPVLL